MLLEWLLPTIFGAILLLIILYNVVGFYLTTKRRKALALRGKEILRARNEKMKEFYSARCKDFPQEISNKIDRLKSISDLSNALSAQEVTSEQLFIHFSKKVIEVGMPLNVLADVDLEKGLAEAKAKDNERKKNPKARFSVFHGVPISVKDQINVVGMKSTNGLIDTAVNYTPDADAVLISVFKNLGAVIAVKSNLPQAVLGMETTNKLYGTSINPWNELRSCGGSSGGEGGLISTGCLPIGLGTDFLGSLRIPPAFCGNYSYRPSTSRSSSKGCILIDRTDIQTFKEALTILGPVAKCVEDIIHYAREVTTAIHKFDPLAPQFVFDEDKLKDDRALNIGYFETLDGFEAYDGAKNAVQEVVDELGKKHVMIPIRLGDDIEAIYKTSLKLISSTGGLARMFETMRYEEIEKIYKSSQALVSAPNFLRTIISKILKCLGQPRLSELLILTKQMTSPNYFQTVKSLEIIKKRLMAAFESQKIDALIFPAFPIPAVLHNTSKDLVPASVYTFFVSSLELPCGIVPIRLSTEKDCKYKARFNDVIDKAVMKNLEGAQGLPISVTVAGMPNQDEVVLRLMKEVEGKFSFRADEHLKKKARI